LSLLGTWNLAIRCGCAIIQIHDTERAHSHRGYVSAAEVWTTIQRCAALAQQASERGEKREGSRREEEATQHGVRKEAGTPVL
jgi:hypothetical protein